MKSMLTTALPHWKDSRFHLVLEECGGNGSCLFYCLAVGASRLYNQTWSMEYVRDRLAASITPSNVEQFLDLLIEDQSKNLVRDTVPFNRSFDAAAVQAVVSATGLGFQGTDIVLRWLLAHDPLFAGKKTGFVLFSSYGPAYTEILNEETATEFILLFNYANSHWQLANIVDANNRAFSGIDTQTLHLLKQYIS